MKKCLGVFVSLLLLSACGGGGGGGNGGETKAEAYRIGGVVSGLYGDAEVLIDGRESRGNGLFIYRDDARPGDYFSIDVTAPEGYRCRLDHGSGTVAESDWLRTVINCQLWRAQPMQRLGSANQQLTAPVFALNAAGDGLALWPVSRQTLASSKFDRQFGWQPQANIEGPTGGSIYDVHLGSDSQGNSLAVWLLRSADSFDVALYAAQFAPDSGWAQPVKVADIANRRMSQLSLDLAVGQDGSAVVAWLSDEAVKAVAFSFAQGWGEVVQASYTPINTSDWQAPLHLNTVIDGAGNAMVVWEATVYREGTRYSNMYWKRHLSASGWEQSREVAGFNDPWDHGENLTHFDVVMNANGDAVMAWAPSYTSRAELYSRSYSHAGGWAASNTRHRFADSVAEISGMKVAINSEMVALAWLDNACCEQRLLANTKPLGGEWSAPSELFSSASEIALRDLYSEAGGRATVLFSETVDGQLRRPYASTYSAQQSWGEPFLLDTPNSAATAVDALTADSDEGGELHIFSVLGDELWHQRIGYAQPDGEAPADDDRPERVNIVGSWAYQLSYSSCPGLSEQGSAQWSYHADGYGLVVKTDKAVDPFNCVFADARLVDDGGEHYQAGSPISAPEFRAGLNDFSAVYHWQRVIFASDNMINVDGLLNDDSTVEATIVFSR